MHLDIAHGARGDGKQLIPCRGHGLEGLWEGESNGTPEDSDSFPPAEVRTPHRETKVLIYPMFPLHVPRQCQEQVLSGCRTPQGCRSATSSSPASSISAWPLCLEENDVHTCNAWQGQDEGWDAQTCPCSFQGLLCESTTSLRDSSAKATKAPKINIPM